MKALLICPGVRPAVPQLAERGPLATAPVLGDALVCHWVEHLASLGARHIKVVAPDRAEHVRTALGDGARWGVQVEVLSVRLEPTIREALDRYRAAEETDWLPAHFGVVLMNYLPGSPTQPLFESYASWFAALLAWLPHAITPARVRVSEIAPGIWVGRRAHVSVTAKLVAPCWVGDQVFVEPGAVVGPGAILEDRSVVEEEVRVAHSWVGPDTFVGPLTSVVSSLAWGSTLVNWRTDSSLRVPDPFLLCSLAPPPAAPVEKAQPHPATDPADAARAASSWLSSWSTPVRPSPSSRPPV